MLVSGCSSGGPTSGTDAGAAGGSGKGGSGKGGSGGGTATGGSPGASGAGGSATGGSSSAGNGGAGGRPATGGTGGRGGNTAGAGGGAGARATGGAGGAGGKATGGAGGKAAGGASGTGGAPGTGGSVDGGATLPGWVLTWSDEFNGPDNSAVDSTKWVYDTGGNGWGNNELEYYTSGTANAVVQAGNLVITATTTGASAFTCSYPSNGPCGYTSARIRTQGKFTQEYGRFEARIQIPEGQGLWPAFWMLGADISNSATNWPKCGEIDIMENIGKEPSINHGSLHLPAAGTANDDELTGMYTLPGGAKLGDGFHTYAVEWSASAIKFYLDDNLYETQTPSTATGRDWEFNQPFFIILNVAVGGNFPGAPSPSTTFPQTMKVDWVRVYEPTDAG
jgi:beta-glucanase (GH16 family)